MTLLVVEENAETRIGLKELLEGNDYRVLDAKDEHSALDAASRERFSHRGKFWQFDDIVVEPPPAQHPHPPFWVAAGSDTSDQCVSLALTSAWMVGSPMAVTTASIDAFLGRAPKNAELDN